MFIEIFFWSDPSQKYQHLHANKSICNVYTCSEGTQCSVSCNGPKKRWLTAGEYLGGFWECDGNTVTADPEIQTDLVTSDLVRLPHEELGFQ